VKATYKVFIKHSAIKELKALPQKELRRLTRAIQSLADNPRPPGAEKLSGQEKYRLRQGAYRIVYSIQDYELTIWVVKIGHRKDVYRRL
jgi:mRNA interferase RelE/StbE